MNMMANTARPWRLSFTMRPNVNANANGMTRIAHVSTKLLNGVEFSNGCDRVHVEEPAAVGAELLDRDLAGGRATRDQLLGRALDGVGRREAVEVLDDALAHEHEREHERERQQDAHRRCG